MARGIESATAKIIRAMEQFEPVEKCISEYRSGHPYRKIAQPQGAPTLEITKQPPIEISVFAGEIVYQLRSALEHIFFDLVERNWNGPVPDRVTEKLMFPLCLNPPGDPNRTPPIPRSSFGEGVIPSCIPDDAFTLIEGLQPYNRRHHGHELLKLLRIFSNIDKHRHLNTTVASITRRHTIRGEGGLSSTAIVPMLQSGAELYEPVHPAEIYKSAMEVEDDYVVDIAFDEPEFGPFQTAPIEDVIYELPTWVFRISTFFRQFLQ